jgi:hypothetical protein
MSLLSQTMKRKAVVTLDQLEKIEMPIALLRSWILLAQTIHDPSQGTVLAFQMAKILSDATLVETKKKKDESESESEASD